MLNQTILNHSSNIMRFSRVHKKETLEDHRIFGLWIYLMSDCILFATLFSAYIVLRHNTANGVGEKEIFNLSLVLVETLLLLCSSFTCSMADLAIEIKDINRVKRWLKLTFLLGLSFVYLEMHEFNHLIIQGYSPQRSAFLSSLFTLLGTHGLHIIFGLFWITIMIVELSIRGITSANRVRLQCLGLFWHFLDIVWIFVFTIVYLVGSI